jgi:predicted short-subunit dehydrogenase-like oxidoreductase (DUF2520 family)
MEKIVIMGAGNVATWLALVLHKSGCEIDVVYSRTLASARKLAGKVNARWTDEDDNIDSDAGIWIYALTDQAIIDTVARAGCKEAFLIHTAGSLPLDILAGHSGNYGVLYPLQTISGRGMPVISRVPVCIESNSPGGIARLESLARSISPLVFEVNSEKRLFLHLAAVFACNFANHMYSIAEEIAGRAGLPFEMYHSLIRETAEKAIASGPLKSQTGPAVRNDEIIIKKHLDLLSFSPQTRDIYQRMTESIRTGTRTPAENDDSKKNK